MPFHFALADAYTALTLSHMPNCNLAQIEVVLGTAFHLKLGIASTDNTPVEEGHGTNPNYES